jgi:hypothetical protein
MKLKFLTLLLLVASYGFSQSINDYKGVIIPMKYDFQKSDNQYRLQTMTKMNLQKAGFLAYYSNETIQANITDRCSLLYIDVQKESGFLVTKLYLVFKDCYGTIIYQSPIGKSREKEFEAAYGESLNLAFESVYNLNYAYNGNTDFSSKSGMIAQSVPVMAAPNVAVPVPVVPAVAVSVPAVAASTTKSVPVISEKPNANLLYAQPTSYGFQLIDSEPKVVMKVYKTSNPASYMAKKGDIQGALVSKGNEWFFEYYQNDTLVSEKIDVKF